MTAAITSAASSASPKESTRIASGQGVGGEQQRERVGEQHQQEADREHEGSRSAAISGGSTALSTAIARRHQEGRAGLLERDPGQRAPPRPRPKRPR